MSLAALRFAIAVLAAGPVLAGCIHVHHQPPSAESCAAVIGGRGEKGAEPRPAGRPAPLAATAAPKPAPAPIVAGVRVLGQVRVIAVGDMIAHGDVILSAAQANRADAKGKSVNHGGFDALFAGLAAILKPADLVFVNLETPIAPASGGKPAPFSFNAPRDLLEALASIGVNMISFANNHVYDQQRRGFIETLDHLERSSLVFAGAGRTCPQAQSARVVAKNGIKIAFLAASSLYNQQMNQGKNKPCAAVFDERAVLAEVATARKAGADLLVLSLHWGAEYHTAPRQDDVDLAHRLFEGGVDVILGHHPHVLQPVEVYEAADGRICLISYSLGNFISNQSRYYVHGLQSTRMGNTRDGVALRFSVVKRDYGQGLVRVELADLSAEPLWTDNNALARQRNRKLPVEIRVRPTADGQREVEGRLLCHPKGPERLDLLKRRSLYEDRRGIAAGIIGDDLVPPMLPMSAGDTKCPAKEGSKGPEKEKPSPRALEKPSTPPDQLEAEGDTGAAGGAVKEPDAAARDPRQP